MHVLACMHDYKIANHIHYLVFEESISMLEEVINVRTPCIIRHYCGTTKTNEAMSITANCSWVSVHKIPGTACLTGSSECHEDRSNTCLKFTNDRTVGMYF